MSDGHLKNVMDFQMDIEQQCEFSLLEMLF